MWIFSRFFSHLMSWLQASWHRLENLFAFLFSLVSDVVSDVVATLLDFLLRLVSLVGPVIGIVGVWLGDFLVLCKDVILWSFDEFLKLAAYMLDYACTLCTGSPFPNISQFVNALPSAMINVLGLIRIPEAIGIIICALGIRMVLQLIPFTRLGS